MTAEALTFDIAAGDSTARLSRDRRRRSLASTGVTGCRVFRPWDGISDDPNFLGCYPLVPWSNRISGGGIEAGGRFWPLRPNWPGEPYPIHGDGWRRPWRVERHTVARSC